MKKISKRLASLLCAVLALTMLLPAAFAAEPVTVALSSVSGQPGQTVTVDVTISEKSNAGNGSMIVNYDPAKLEFVSFKAGAFGGLAEGGLYQENGKAVPGKISIALWSVEPFRRRQRSADHLQNPERFRQYPAEAGDEGACGLHAGWHGNRPDGYGQDGKRQRFHQSAYNRPCHNQAHHNSA